MDQLHPESTPPVPHPADAQSHPGEYEQHRSQSLANRSTADERYAQLHGKSDEQSLSYVLDQMEDTETQYVSAQNPPATEVQLHPREGQFRTRLRGYNANRRAVVKLPASITEQQIKEISAFLTGLGMEVRGSQRNKNDVTIGVLIILPLTRETMGRIMDNPLIETMDPLINTIGDHPNPMGPQERNVSATLADLNRSDFILVHLRPSSVGGPDTGGRALSLVLESMGIRPVEGTSKKREQRIEEAVQLRLKTFPRADNTRAREEISPYFVRFQRTRPLTQADLQLLQACGYIFRGEPE